MKIYTWEARDKKNIKLDELVKLTGISRGTLNNIENGKTSPRLSQLEKIAEALEVKIADLFDTEGK